MANDLPLFNTRRNDPPTSHEAGRGVERWGIAEAHRQLVLRHVLAYPGRTCSEIAEAEDMVRERIAKRLPELRRQGLVYNGESRECRVAGTKQMTWWPTPKAIEESMSD